jgi:Uma2 family endonuclease
MEEIKALPGTLSDPLYPEEDAENVGESSFHLVAWLLLCDALWDYFARKPDVLVAADLFWYWEKGKPSACRAPDVMVVKGVGNHQRRSFRQWEESARPCALFEITSERTWREDLGEKRAQYERLAVPEYFVFDPEGVFVQPVFQGFRLQGGKYVPLPAANDGSVESNQLGLRLTNEGTMLRLRDAKTGRRVLTREEANQRATRKVNQATRRALRAEQLAKQNAARLAALEVQNAARVSALEAELARLRALLNPPAAGEPEKK